MNTQTTFSLSTTYLRHCTLSWLLILFLSATGMAADLTFTPNAPIVEQGKQITLSVSGTSGEVTWTPNKGQIQGTGTQVTYIAPDQPGLDGVMVMDGAGNIGTVKVTVTVKSIVSLENASLEIFTNRSDIQALLLSDDGKTLWVGTSGGLEKRDAQTGEIQQFFINTINTDGLPANSVKALLSDSQGGLWVGTDEGGLAHYTALGQWQVFNPENSGLPDNNVSALLSDGQGGLWVGTWEGGLAHYTAPGEWQVLNLENSGLPANSVAALLSDGQGGLWVGTRGGGLAHYIAPGEWQVFNFENSGLPNNLVTDLLSDSQGGLWVGTDGGGLAHYTVLGEWQVFNPKNSGLPNHYSINALLSDSQGGLWVGTWGGGLAHYTAPGEWQVFNPENSGLPNNSVGALLSDSQGGLWVGTWARGLAHYTAPGEWQVFNPENSGLPNNSVTDLLSDSQGGLWIGTFGGGLAHYTAQKQWQVFNPENSGLPDNQVEALVSDSQGGLWVGTFRGGLAHYTAQGQWQVFNAGNSGLPDNTVWSLLSDSQSGLWVGTSGNRLAHYTAQGQWQVFNAGNSGLPDSTVWSLLSDSQGGLWVGTSEGLAHYTAPGEWQVFNPENSGLPDNTVSALLSDSQGGLWVGTNGGGLAHYTAPGEWQVFNSENSGLSDNNVRALLSDSQGGLWVGTYEGGLAHYTAPGEWQVFNPKNLGLPGNYVGALVSDSQGGLWIGTRFGGLAHLTFTQKTALCQTTDATTCENLLADKRAAIIIAGGGNDENNDLWDDTESITAYLYKVLKKRGFDDNEIYYLTPKSWADFNGDGLPDNIVDTPKPDHPLTVDDVRVALEWAKQKGKLGQPLYLFFVDHGGINLDKVAQLQLAKQVYLEAPDLKAMLDDYQQATGNQVVMVIDACYSGAFVQQLVAPNRAIISSADADELANFVGKQGFSRFFAEGLNSGNSFAEAFGKARLEQQKLIGNSTRQTVTGATESSTKKTQTPQLDDNGDGVSTVENTATNRDGQWLNQVYLNGDLKTGDVTLAVEIADKDTLPATLTAGQSLLLKARAGTVSGGVEQVWAVIRPPRMNLVIGSNGTPILAFPRQQLSRHPTDKLLWEAAWDWDKAVYNGDYDITFYAQDHEKNIASSDSVVIKVEGGIDPPPQATVQLQLSKDRYQRGEPFQAHLVEELGWGYDLYAAVLFPDGQNFMTLKNTNELRPMNEAKPWYAPRKPRSPLTLFELTLPADLPTGKYCLFGILSPEQNEVFETLEKGLWVMDRQCFEVF